MSTDLNNFIEWQYRNYIGTGEPNTDFIHFYDSFPNKQLQELFSTLHANAIRLFDRMNYRLPTGDEPKNYLADDSRSLIFLIETVNTLQKELEDTEYAFHIDNYYSTVFKNCDKWLEQYNGSTIPAHMKKITLYYRKPLFISDGVMPNAELHVLGEKIARLGSGGFGDVYKYRHPLIDMDFAIKIFNPSFTSEEGTMQGRKRFFREAKILFQLNHQNIVKIYDIGIIEGRPFIKMEFIDGMTLQEVHNKYSNLPFKNAGRAIIQVLSGLQYAHNQGIIHRDLKPANVMADTRTKGWKFKIIDFGISAFKTPEEHTKLTKTGEHIAGGRYIAPELIDTPELRDVRSDIYSVGAILFFLLCGQPPMADAREYLSKSNNTLTDEQIDVVMKALSSNIDSRYRSCDEMRAAIAQTLDQ